MKAKYRFLLAVIVLGLLMTGPFMVTVLLVWLGTSEDEHAELVHLLFSHLPTGIAMTVAGFVVGVVVLRKLFKQYVDGLLSMSEKLRLMLGANRNFRVTPEGPPEVQHLARAANEEKKK
jgi:DNA polymerase-3 subunit epsilon